MTTVFNLLDDSTRPKAPKIEGVTPAQRMRGNRLAALHAFHLSELAEVNDAMARIEAGQAQLVELGEAVSNLKMSGNYKLFGNLCGRECLHLTFHHTTEDEQLFPMLAMAGSEGLRKVIERLTAEHESIHAIIMRMEAQAFDIIETPTAEKYLSLKETFSLLHSVVKSHFGYEETELEDSIGYHGVAF